MRGYTGGNLDNGRHETMQAGVHEMRRQWIWTAVLVAALVVIALVRTNQSGGRITAAVNDTQIGISGSERESWFIALSDIDSVELADTDTLDIGVRQSGPSDTPNLYEGEYLSDTYGICRAIVGPKSSEVIVIRYSGEKVFLLGGLSDADTTKLYDAITRALEEENR